MESGRVTVENAFSGEALDHPRPRARQCRRAVGRAGAGGGLGVSARAKVRLVQGSHIVVRKLYEHDRAYMFQNSDGRIVFVIPYQDDFTLIGTTDRDYDGDPAKVKASREEIEYLCDAVSEYLAKPVRPEHLVWTYAGVRPLYDDGASEAKAATREYVFELDTPGGAPLLSIYGGKITTHRRLAEEALEKLAPYLDGAKAREGWTGKSPLPGGDMDVSAGRGAFGGTGAQLSIPEDGACQPPGACVRHPRQQALGQRKIRRRSRPVVRRQLDGGRSQVPDVNGVGLHGRRHRMAAIKAWIAIDALGNCRHRRLDSSPSRLP